MYVSETEVTRMIISGNPLYDIIGYITPYCEEMLKPENSFKSVLILGLGLGLIPQYIADNMLECTVIDVIDNNQELIDWTLESTHLKPKINIFLGECHTYEPTRQYDLIIADIWWDIPDVQEVYTELTLKYNDTLTSTGKIYFPLLRVITSKL